MCIRDRQCESQGEYSARVEDSSVSQEEYSARIKDSAMQVNDNSAMQVNDSSVRVKESMV